MKLEEYISESSSAMALDRGKELHSLLTKEALEILKDSGMKTKKEAAKIFQQAIKLLKGLK